MPVVNTILFVAKAVISFVGTTLLACAFFLKVVWLFTIRYVEVVNEYTAKSGVVTKRTWARYWFGRYPMRLFLLAFVPFVFLIVPFGVIGVVSFVLGSIDQATRPDFSVSDRFVNISEQVDGKPATLQEKEKEIGAALMHASYYQLERELDSSLGWTVNDVTGLQWWDNRVNRQLGVRHATIEALAALSMAISKFGSADEENQLLVGARQSHLAIDPTSWFLPAAENEYRNGIEKVKQYQRDVLAEAEHVTINITNRDIEVILRIVDARVLEVPHGRLNARNFDVSWWELDDRVFYAQGAAIVARDMLVAIKSAFADKIIAAGAMGNMEQGIASCEGAVDFHPWLISRGDGDSMLPDHRAKMSRYYTDCRRRIVDVADAIVR
jgi:hypothetical protein